jgi:hypothetical protein
MNCIPEEYPIENYNCKYDEIADIFIENFVLSKNPKEFIKKIIEKDQENTGLEMSEFINVINDVKNRYFSVLRNKTCHHCRQTGVNVLHCSYVGQCCRKCIDLFVEEAEKRLAI